MKVVVVGAGMSGLTCAQGLVRQGHEVVVVDKGRSVGGRMATRRDGEATFDHGAQFFTVRTDAFHETVTQWQHDGIVHEWCRGFVGDDGHPRYVATSGMSSLAKHLAQGIDVQCSVAVTSIEPNGSGWKVTSSDTEPFFADVVVVTAPLPQTVALLELSGVQLPEQLRNITYDPTVGLLAVVDKPLRALPISGGIQDPDDVFSFIADNSSKRVSRVPAVTFHANAKWSEQHFEHTDEWLHHNLLSAAQQWLQDTHVTSSQIKKWRYATPRTTWPDSFWISAEKTLILAGDAFNGPKIEGAYLSGYAAVTALA